MSEGEGLWGGCLLRGSGLWVVVGGLGGWGVLCEICMRRVHLYTCGSDISLESATYGMLAGQVKKSVW